MEKNCLFEQMKASVNNPDLPKLAHYLYCGEAYESFTITTGLPAAGTPIYAEVTNLESAIKAFSINMVNNSWQVVDYIIPYTNLQKDVPITGAEDLIEDCKHIGITIQGGGDVLLKIWY